MWHRVVSQQNGPWFKSNFFPHLFVSPAVQRNTALAMALQCILALLVCASWKNKPVIWNYEAEQSVIIIDSISNCWNRCLRTAVS